MTIEARFATVRAFSEALVAPLSDADATLQSMDDASPAKWHLAHTTWFFETFLLRDHLQGYRLFCEDWPYLFNSYYEAEGPRHARPRRGMLSRPSLAQVLDYRTYVNQEMQILLGREELISLIELGLNHEQQHQELLLTDIKHAFWCNPLGPIYAEVPVKQSPLQSVRSAWLTHPGGVVMIGHAGDGFAFDNEGPSHEVLLQPFELADRLVTNGEWDAFIADGGYENHALWLSDGWAWVQQQGITAPLYWREDQYFTLNGWQVRDPDAPVAHISQYEADAYAAWAGCRLPTEFEWEALAVGDDTRAGNQLDSETDPSVNFSHSLFGDRWQWTRSAYLPYPRFAPAKGAVGEYNGKFMSGQAVLKGASCATPRDHSRASYRNFFPAYQRWQFTGLRLAKDV